jgi:hypothetical protein
VFARPLFRDHGLIGVPKDGIEIDCYAVDHVDAERAARGARAWVMRMPLFLGPRLKLYDSRMRSLRNEISSYPLPP